MKSTTIYLERNINEQEFDLKAIEKEIARLHSDDFPEYEVQDVTVIDYYLEEVLVQYKVVYFLDNPKNRPYKILTFKEA